MFGQREPGEKLEKGLSPEGCECSPQGLHMASQRQQPDQYAPPQLSHSRSSWGRRSSGGSQDTRLGGRLAEWEIKELPRVPRGLPRPRDLEDYVCGGRKLVGRGISNFTPRMPDFVLLFTDLKTESLKIFDSPSEFQKPKDLSPEWEPETFRISLRFQEIRLLLSAWMLSMARGDSQSIFSQGP